MLTFLYGFLTVRNSSIETMKMMDRAVALADTQAVGGRNRRRYPGLRMADGLLQRFAFGEVSCNRRRQGAAGAMGVVGREARRGQRDHVIAREEIVDTFAALPVTALDEHGA